MSKFLGKNGADFCRRFELVRNRLTNKHAQRAIKGFAVGAVAAPLISWGIEQIETQDWVPGWAANIVLPYIHKEIWIAPNNIAGWIGLESTAWAFFFAMLVWGLFGAFIHVLVAGSVESIQREREEALAAKIRAIVDEELEKRRADQEI